jgi:hypothetical protein
MVELLVSVAGWGAMVLILGAYYLVTVGRLSGQSQTYQWMNIVGAAGFLINSGWNHALPSAALNFVWMGIGIYSLRLRAKADSG